MDVKEFKQEYRLSQWGELVKEQRQSGLTIRAWCMEKGISPKTYYYRLRKVREAICQDVVQKQAEIVEIPLTASECKTTGLRIITGNGTMEISDTTPETVERLLRVMIHAE